MDIAVITGASTGIGLQLPCILRATDTGPA